MSVLPGNLVRGLNTNMGVQTHIFDARAVTLELPVHKQLRCEEFVEGCAKKNSKKK
jgi:hypothetical protein